MTAGTADQIDSLAQDLSSGRTTIGGLVDRLGASGTGLCLLLLGLTSLVPGVAPVLGVPLCTVAAGMALGRTTPWVPGPVRRWSMDGARLGRGLERLVPRLAWLERHLVPRGQALTGRAGFRLAGAAALVDGLLVVLPIPFGNTAPALATIVLALGLLTRDGLAIGAGLALTLAALAIDVALVGLGAAALTGLIQAVV